MIKISSLFEIYSAKDFTTFHLKYDETMANNTFKFQVGEMDVIKNLIGKREKIILFFLGFEDQMNTIRNY